jgi:hypothetical protein
LGGWKRNLQQLIAGTHSDELDYPKDVVSSLNVIANSDWNEILDKKENSYFELIAQ